MATISEFVGEFNRHHKQYVNIEKQVETICKEKLRARNVKFSWQSRVKKASSLEKKLRDRSHCYPTEAHNTADIKDLVAGRILLTRWKDLAHVEEIVKENFNLESRTQHPKSDSAQRSLTLQTRFRGYGGLHFYVRRKAPTDEKYSDLIIEIQVLSAIMYAWSELERDFQYKQLNGEQSRAIYLVLEALKGVTNSGEVLLELVEELEHDRDLDLPRIKDFVLENQNMILQQLQQSEKLNTKQKTLSSLGPDQIACLAALSPADPQHERKALVETKGVRVKGTCEWIKSSGPYEEWSKSTSSHILWITGGPGKGKTMTSMFLTEELEKQARQAPSTILLEYFCNNNDAAWNTALGIVRGSIYQLLHENETLWKYILRPYQTEVERQKQAKERGVPLKHEFFRNFSALWEIFQNMLQEQKQKRTYYILDGLDECDDESIEKILEALSKLYNTLPSDVFFKTILVSRVFPGNIRNPLNSVDSFKLDLDSGLNVHEDLQRFIAFEMEQNFKGTSISGPWRKSFESKVLKKAEGTFLWAEFAMRELRLKTCAEAEQILEGLPSGLDAMYGRMLLRILPRRRQSLIQILKWVVTAFRPLTLMELCDALCVDHFRFDSRGEAVLDHISQFGYILVTKDNTVNLVHQSVKDYLLRKEPGMNQDLACFRIVEEDAHATIMQSCIEYMQNGCLNDGPVVSPKGGATPLSYAAVYGYEDLVLLLLERGAIVDARSDEDSFYSPLIVASYSGNKRVVKLLLDKGADISAQSQYRTAILLASAKGNVEVVQLLQDRGAIVDDTNRYHNNALQIASLKGNAEVVWLLLKAGADVNSLSLEGKTALDLAVKGRHQMIERGLRSSAQSYEEVIQLLREAQSQEGPNKAKRRRRAGQL